MSTLRQSLSTGTDSDLTLVHNTKWYAQGFTPDVTHVIDQVDVYIKKVLSPGDLTISIQGDDGTGKPDGVEIAVGTIAEADVGITYAWETCTLSSTATLTAGTTYCIVLKALSGDVSNYYTVAGVTGNPYSGGIGTYTLNSGGVWNLLADTIDLYFKEYGDASRATATPSDKSHTKRLVAIAGNQVWYDVAGTPRTLSELEAARDDIDCSNPLTIAEAYGKVFVANKDKLRVADFINVKLDLGSGNELVDPPAHGDILTQDQTSDDYAYMVVDFVDSTKRYIYGYAYYGGDATAFNTTNTVASADTIAVMNPATFTPSTVTNPPHWYTWTAYPDCVDADAVILDYGDIPNQATLVCNYRGRVTLSGNPEAPYQWFQSRQANPWDFAYDSIDAQAAVRGGSSDAGEIGDSVVALIPYKDDYLIFGCVNTMWYLAGDAKEGGSILELDLTSGIYGSKSWCFDNEGNLWYEGTNGIYKTSILEKPVCISEISLPNLVKDEAVDPSIHRIVLAYDRRRAGILISITKLSDGSNSNYFYDLRTGGFFPETYPDECGIYSAIYYEATDPTYRELIVGGSDGYIRHFDEDEEDDDAGASGDIEIDAYVTFGPIQMSRDPKLTGKLTGLNCVTAGRTSGSSDSDDITYNVWVDRSAANVIKKLLADTSPDIAGTVTAPGRRRGGDIRKKIKNVYMGIKLQNDTATKTWAFEQLLVDLKPSGRLK